MSHQPSDATSREIRRQADLLETSLRLDVEQAAGPLRSSATVPVLVGCGTSHYLAQAGAQRLRAHSRQPAVAATAGDVWLDPETELDVWPDPCVVAISRSGVTTEVVRAAEVAKARGVPVVAVTTEPSSELARLADGVIALTEARESSIVMTGSFSAMLFVLERLALQRATALGRTVPIGRLDEVPDALRPLVDRHRATAHQHAGAGHQRYVYLGSGSTMPVALEGMLKMKEMTQLDAQAFPAMEFRHGPVSILDASTCVVLIHDGQRREHDLALAEDLRSREATVTAVGPGELLPEGIGANVATPARFPPSFTASFAMPYLQWLAYERCVMLGKDPDRPKGLSPVVHL